MKYKVECIKTLFILLAFLLALFTCHLNRAESFKKSTNNRSFKLASHNEFHQKVVEELNLLKQKGKGNQGTTLRSIEKAFTNEFKSASDKIEVNSRLTQKLITEGLSVFDDDKLFDKCIELTRNPSLVVFSSSLEQGLSPSFKEVANITMNKLQRKTMNILVEDDLKIEKLRHPKIMIFTEKPSKKKRSKKTTKMVNGPISLPDNYMLNSFLETSTSVQGRLENNDAKINEKGKTNLETDTSEKKLIKYAEEKFKLVSMLTIKELQENLLQELIPYFVVSKKSTDKLNEIVEKNALASKPNVLQINTSELTSKFPDLTIQNNSIIYNQELLNQFIYKKLLSLSSHLLKNDTHLRKKFIHNIKTNLLSITGESKEPIQKYINKRRIVDFTEKMFRERLKFEMISCSDISNKLTNKFVNVKLNCSKYSEDYNQLKNTFKKSYSKLYTSGTIHSNHNGSKEYIKDSLSNDTIDKLIAQMITRNDLYKKFHRLKTVELVSQLYDLERMKIKQILQEKLKKKLDKFGPATVEVKERIK